MRYFGGKAKIVKPLSKFLNSVRKSNQIYWEPFVGGGWVIANIKNIGIRTASDVCEPLIDLYLALQKGWIPPSEVSSELYQQAKNGEVSPELQAFIGFGCSFAGKWFGGHATSPTRNYAENAKNSLLRKMKNLQNVKFEKGKFDEIYEPENWLIYCDPPYQGTTGYKAAGEFDTTYFWTVIRKWSKNNDVYVSEYNAPEDFEIIKEFNTKTDIRTKNGQEKRIERLFKFKG